VNILSAILGAITSIVAYTLLLAGVYKLYSIGNDLSEIKKIMREHTPEQPFQRLDQVLRE
jgi:hypothetical protein